MLHVGYPVRDLFDLTSGIECTGMQIHQTTNREIARFLWAIKQHHVGTYQHSLNVSRLSFLLAMKLGLSRREIVGVYFGALLHDFGKIRIDTTILDKKGCLTDEETLLFKKHPLNGVALLSPYRWAKELFTTIETHHERIDGCGYYRMSGSRIPLSARIINGSYHELSEASRAGGCNAGLRLEQGGPE